MVDPKASRFWLAALQSELMDAEGLAACFEAIPPEKRVPEHIDRRLARQAVQRGSITLWQAQQLLAGRSAGFKIDRYVLLDLIGQGGMGRVYLAKDTRLNRRVAVKILSPERVNNPRAIARFEREARVGAQLQHENLVRIYDEGHANGKCYIVMEFIEGKNIGAMIAEGGPIPPRTAARLVRQVALGLAHAHQKGLIHRDVNPYNILVTRDGTAKLTDLGLAIDLADEAPVTRDGATVGTFDYVSPEQARHSHSVDTRSDIYSLGCTLYHMIAGRVPFPTPSLPEKLFGHQAIDPEPLTGIAPGVPEGLAQVVMKMMRKPPDERYATPLEVAEALAPYADGPKSPVPWDATPPIQNPPPRSSGSDTTITAPPARVTPAPSNGDRAPAWSGLGQAASESPARQAPIDLGIVLDRAPDAPSAERPKRGRTSEAADAVPAASAPGTAASTPEAASGETRAPARSRDRGEAVDFSRLHESTAQVSQEAGGLDLGITLGPPSSPPTSGRPSSAPSAPGPSPLEPRPVAAKAGPAAPRVEPATTVDLSPDGTTTARSDESEADVLGLGLNLGPEPSSGRAGSPGGGRTARGAGAVPEATNRAGRPRRLDPRLLIGAGAVGLLLACAGLAAWMGAFGRPSTTPARRVVDKGGSPSKEKGGTPAPASVAGKGAEEEVPRGSGFAVRLGSGEITTEPDLKSAMQRAIWTKGRVILNHSEPLKLKGRDAAIRLAGGRLIVAAAPGTRPVLEVEMSGKSPFLSARSDTPVQLIGVTIRARFPGDAGDAPPVIQAGQELALERCAFHASGPAKGKRAVASEGGTVRASGCWFEGFDQALDLSVHAGRTIALKQCMIVRAQANDGWALRVRSMPGGDPLKQLRKVVLDRCTVRGEGLLDLIGFTPEAPLGVELKESAVVSQVLVAWESKPGQKPLPSPALKWSGVGNLYDIRGKAWVVRGPGGSDALPGGPADLASWTKSFTDLNTVASSIKFRTDPGTPAEALVPQDFAVEGEGSSAVGADPDEVGPRAPAVK